MYSGKTSEDWERLEQATFLYNRAQWMAFPTLRVMHEPTFFQEWKNEWTKDQFIQVNVSSLLSWHYSLR